MTVVGKTMDPALHHVVANHDQRVNLLMNKAVLFHRVMPTYLFVLLWYATLGRHIAQGPYQMDAFTKPDVIGCAKYWWANLLFINNFVPGRVEQQV